ncbi:MAG: DUF1573 domain-containing protein [Bacteroidia bacterium]|nr:DUF1573 domain-containing protein [Bacteroidia bacterium]
MKNLYQLSTLLFAFLLLIGAQPLMAQQPAEGVTPAAGEEVPTEGPMIEFEKTTHDFGTLTQGDPAVYEFKFTNTGTADLTITYAKGSCGCTVPKWPQEPIAPGKSDVIKVKYDSNRIGGINKNVTITSNAVNAPTQRIYIIGNINAKPAPAPGDGAPAPDPNIEQKVTDPAHNAADVDHSGHNHQ